MLFLRLFGGLAQLAERVLSMHEVAGSIPAFSIIFFTINACSGQIILVNCFLFATPQILVIHKKFSVASETKVFHRILLWYLVHPINSNGNLRIYFSTMMLQDEEMALSLKIPCPVLCKCNSDQPCPFTYNLNFLIIEMIKGKPLSDKFMERAQVAGFVILLSLMVFAFGNDILKGFGI